MCIRDSLEGSRPRSVLRELKAVAPDERAKNVRLVVYNFATCYMGFVRKILDLLPLVHDIVLPDRDKTSPLLVGLSFLIEDCKISNPRLRRAIFAGGDGEQLW